MSVYLNNTEMLGISLPSLSAPTIKVRGRCTAEHPDTNLQCTVPQGLGHYGAHYATKAGQTFAIWHDDLEDHSTSYPMYFNQTQFPIEVYPYDLCVFRSESEKSPGCGVMLAEDRYRCNSHAVPGYHAVISDQLYVLEQM